MAIYPNEFNTKDKLQPGARGEKFQSDFPGHRDEGDRINRTNMKLSASEHDVPNIKYMFDYRLPTLFRYGWAVGYNQIVIPKGRMVAADPFMDLVDFDMQKQHNTLTLANGGVPVRIRESGDNYRSDSGASNPETALVSPEKQGQEVNNIGTEWIPLKGMEDAYTKLSFRPFAGNDLPMAQLESAGYEVNSENGKVYNTETGKEADNVRPGNYPIGMMQRNEYTRDEDALNGMMPGPVITDKLVELPWFAYKDKAEQNPWGSAYGGLFPGALVRSDENGRLTLSPLSFLEAEMPSMDVAEYEAERQQVVGQVYAVYNDLLPEGAAKWATWALEDRKNFEEFCPAVWPQTGRRGEDAVSNSPYHSTGEYPGYPYDKAYKDHDLHMLNEIKAGRLGNYDRRMQQEYQYEDLGIPGLTDGKNAVVRNYDPERAGYVKYAGGEDYVDMFFRTTEVDLMEGTLQIGVSASGQPGNFINCEVGAEMGDGIGGAGSDFLKVKYADEKQGIVVLEVTDKNVADAALDPNNGGVGEIEVWFEFKKRGMAGVPTFLDWDGAVGSVRILLTK